MKKIAILDDYQNVSMEYIKLSKIGYSNIAEMRDFDRIRDTIKKIILY